jgi:ABC-2 type transport system ATP-binding protein
MKNVIEVKNLIKKYKKSEKNSVDNISFSVKEGEFFALLGPNGAGKTTTISILTTILSKTSGDIKIANFDTESEASDVRKNIGVIFQNPSLDLNLTAEENIRFHANLYGLYNYKPSFNLMPTEYQKKVIELAEVVGLTSSDLKKPVKALSGGMKRKLEIIRSLMHNPKILFLDEPTTGLDPVSRKSLWNYLQKIRKEENITIFLTTHYLDEAEGADNICIIANGKIIQRGSPQQIKEALIDEYMILDSDDREKLKSELKNLDIKFSDNGPFKIDIKHNRESQKIINSIKSELNLIKIYSPTLEEAYINIIEQNHQ